MFYDKLIREEKNIALFLNLIPKLVHYAEYYEIRTCNWQQYMYKYTHYEQTNYIYRQSLELDGNSETLLGPKQITR